jgi:hypothetical protein
MDTFENATCRCHKDTERCGRFSCGTQLCPAQLLLGTTRLIEMSEQGSVGVGKRSDFGNAQWASCRNGVMG